MTHVRFPSWIVAFIILSLGFAEAARAEPLVVTGGGWDQDTGDPPGPYSLRGTNFDLNLFVVHATFVGTPFACPTGCAPGTPINLSTQITGTFSAIDPSNLLQVRSTISGVTYTNLFLDGSLAFTAATFTIPPVHSFVERFNTPFAFSGHLTAFSDPERRNLVFDNDLTGSGQAFLLLAAHCDPGTCQTPTSVPLLFQGVGFEFSDAAAPVPEPASLLLFGTGIVLTGLKTRRRFSVTRRSSARDRDAE